MEDITQAAKAAETREMAILIHISDLLFLIDIRKIVIAKTINNRKTIFLTNLLLLRCLLL
jgi:hypothetical protein